MIKILLQRTRRKGKAVVGKMTIPFSRFPVKDDEQDATVATLENADYLIPAGTYPVERTWSPRFKKFLPLIENVPDRDGIRIHRGTIPEHSKGCILLDLAGMSNVNILFNQLENEDEKAQIEIMEEFTA